MRKGRMDLVLSIGRRRPLHILLLAGILYLVLVTFEIPFVLYPGGGIPPQDAGVGSIHRAFLLESAEDRQEKEAPFRPRDEPLVARRDSSQPSPLDFGDRRLASGLNFAGLEEHGGVGNRGSSELQKSAREAWVVGNRVWSDIWTTSADGSVEWKEGGESHRNASESCPQSISLSGAELRERRGVMVLPCGLTLGSHLTIVGRPLAARAESDPKIAPLRGGARSLMVSQFMVELQGLKTVEGEDPPRILHFNPRLKGDWSGKPVIEQNTCYRMQWGTALRCEGWKSLVNEETVDGLVKCEKWIQGDGPGHDSDGSKNAWWLNRLIGRTKKVSFEWPYPFAEGKLFVLTISAGLEGYHVNVDGRHVTSFPYRTGFVFEDATGLSVIGDVDVEAIFAASLPSSHPSFLPQRHLEMSSNWKAPPLPGGSVELFIGILSAGNHFTERMAVRKSWMQHSVIKSSKVVVRFFVALHGRKEVNAELKKEAEFFSDMVIVPFLDSYDLVVLKTIAICHFGVHAMSAKYIMKCDDDTFIRVDSVTEELKKISSERSLYLGNINYFHKPLRHGKWAVTYEEWPEEDYPPYANGPGYIVSSDIAMFVVSEFERSALRLFKMEDVSMGMWVEQFNRSRPVQYLHNLRFCQHGCIEDYYTAHYQSPRQMMCMWNIMRMGKPQCCDMR